jgi:hypothetical protein
LSWADTTGRSARTAPARGALRQKFLDQVDGDPVRAQHLWKARLAHPAPKSAQARRRTREQVTLAAAADDELRGLIGNTTRRARTGPVPTRFARQLTQTLRGGIALGMDREHMLRIVARCAADSMPPLRLAAPSAVYANPDSSTNEVRR